MFIVNLIRGFFMALADSVPGVSGGTIAFILGFYDEFIGSLNTLVSKNSKEEKIQALQFLLKIGVGWAIGMITSVLFLASIFEEHIYSISSVFIGFIIFSILAFAYFFFTSVILISTSSPFKQPATKIKNSSILVIPDPKWSCFSIIT